MDVLPRAYFQGSVLSRRCWFAYVSHIYVVCAPPADAVYAESSVRGLWACRGGGGDGPVPVGAARPAGRRRGAAGGGADQLGRDA